MGRSVKIRMMGEFVIVIDGQETPSIVNKSRKGAALVEYLILNRGKQVPKQRLQNMFWSDFLHNNPESALKTLVSRIRKILNDACDGLGNCIMSERGSYRWESMPDMEIDLLEIMDLYELLAREKDEGRKRNLYSRLMRLYRGDLYLTGDIEGGEGYQAALHSEYLNAVYDYIELLMEKEEYSRIVDVCGRALSIDEFDERLHMEMMQAQVNSNNIEDAMEQYRRMAELNQRYLDAEPSEEIRLFYKKLIQSGKSLKYNLENVSNDLKEGMLKRGAFVCEYDAFKQYFHMMNPTLERLGCTMFLGMITLREKDQPEASENEVYDRVTEKIMEDLIEILRVSLRRGDLVTRYSSTVALVLLPTVNHTTGNMIMERIRHMFQEKHPSASIPFHYRLGELGSLD